jgi:hypothetical protein
MNPSICHTAAQFSPAITLDISANSVVSASKTVSRGFPLQSDVDDLSSRNLDSCDEQFVPSAIGDGSVVCKVCHDVLQPLEVASHRESCEMMRRESVFSDVVLERAHDATAKVMVSVDSNGSPNPSDIRLCTGSLTQPSICKLFSISDIQEKFAAKRAELLHGTEHAADKHTDSGRSDSEYAACASDASRFCSTAVTEQQSASASDSSDSDFVLLPNRRVGCAVLTRKTLSSTPVSKKAAKAISKALSPPTTKKAFFAHARKKTKSSTGTGNMQCAESKTVKALDSLDSTSRAHKASSRFSNFSSAVCSECHFSGGELQVQSSAAACALE